jgi:hypothetical protein
VNNRNTTPVPATEQELLMGPFLNINHICSAIECFAATQIQEPQTNEIEVFTRKFSITTETM